MKVGIVQHDIAWESRDETLARVEPLVDKTVADGASFVVLPEMFAVGFSMNTDAVAEPVDGPTAQWLVAQAARHGVWIGGSVPEGRPRPRNTFVLAGPDSTVHRYAKRHPFGFGGETEHYDAGDERLTVDVDGVRVSPLICYDLRFADASWPLAGDTDVYVYVASWPSPRRHHWRSLLVARAIENQAYVVGVNRVGSGGGLDYAGDSLVVDPMGELVVDAGSEEGAHVVEVDPAVVAQVRADLPFLGDRRG
ncbi:MAG TPA: carbon-nitrogen family hydrolase [Acidimicrobiales bacterium]|nr:carbon-nitrogen family hydrolase [Acidimicrobiales bacterium]